MGLFEIIFEGRNPGTVGKVERNDEKPEPVSLGILMIKLLASSLFIWFLYYMTIRGNINLINIIFFIGGLTVYCLIGYHYIPKPATSNIGWIGGMIDNPFRYSDDLNRMLIGLLVILFPGRFVTTTVKQSINYWRQFNQKKIN